MLVLTREENQGIIIGPITIIITEVRGERVRVGIQAPTDIPIIRTELAPHERKLTFRQAMEFMRDMLTEEDQAAVDEYLAKVEQLPPDET